MSIDLRSPSDPRISVRQIGHPFDVAQPRSSSARARSDQRQFVLTLMGLATVGAAVFSDASPAGIDGADAIYRGLFAGVVVGCSARSRRWTWAILAGVATLCASSMLAQIASLAALGVCGWSLAKGRRTHLLGALIAALALPSLLTQGVGPIWRLSGGHLSDPFAMSALLTFLATAPVLRAGWRTISRRKRRTIRTRTRHLAWAVAAVVIFSGVICATAAPSMFRGLQQTQEAAELVTSGEADLATMHFESATDAWNRSNSILSGPWMVPARLVPVLGQHVRAAQVVSGQASAITKAAATTTERVNPDDLIIDGAVNLAEVDRISPAVDAFAATLDRATIRIAETNSPWLAPPIRNRIDRAFEILNPASGVAGVTAEALHVGGDLLGSDEPAYILVMFSTPAEARGAGGFIGNWALVETNEGRLSIKEQFRTRELNALLESVDAELNADPDYQARYGRFSIERHIQDVTMSPDFPSVAPVAADLFRQATGQRVDAVVSIDPFVIQKLLQFSGPLNRADDRVLSGSNAAQELLVEQYIDFGKDEAARESELSEMTATVLSSMLASPPDPISFATELAPLVEQQRMSLWLADDFDGSIAEKLGLDGAFPTPDHDLFAIVHQNAGQNKIDTFLERDVSITTRLDNELDRVAHDVTITLNNGAPASGLPDAILASNDQGLDLGTNRMMLSLYTELPLISATIDGVPAPVMSETEFGRPVYTLVLDIAPGGFRVLDLRIEGDLPIGDFYEMALGAQPTVTPDAYSWHVFAENGDRLLAPDGWTSHADGVRWSAILDRDKTVRFPIEK